MINTRADGNDYMTVSQVGVLLQETHSSSGQRAYQTGSFPRLRLQRANPVV